MLAAIPHPTHSLSQSMPYSHSQSPSASAFPESDPPAEDKVCPGCQLTVMDENGGVVIAFGQSFFHIDCFKCAKCRDRVTADTNLLLLSDGQPVCSNCSYSCSVCHQPILDEAIMTGDDSYHAHCFKCRSCHNRIDELMFAKTSHGIYCMKCHHQRVARSRRHAQKQKERGNASVAHISSKPRAHITKELSVPPVNALTGLFTPDSAPDSLPVSTSSSAQTSPARSRPTSQHEQPSTQLGRDERQSASHASADPAQSSQRTSQNLLPSPTSPFTVSPPADFDTPRARFSDPLSPAVVVSAQEPEAGSQVAFTYLQPSNESGSAASFLNLDRPASIERRSSYADETRPLDKNTPPPSLTQSAKASGNPTTTKSNDKSISAPQSPSPTPSLDTGRASDHTGIQADSPADPPEKHYGESPASAPAVPVSMPDHSRSQIGSPYSPPSGFDPSSQPPRQEMTLERLPPRTHSLGVSSQDPTRNRWSPPTPNGASGRTSSDEKDRSNPGSFLSIDVEKSRTGYGIGKRPKSPGYKAPSPAHKVDVPQGIESETDTTDGECSPDKQTRTLSLPTKEEAKSRRRPVRLELDMNQSALQEGREQVSFLSNAGDADSEGESSPVERMSRSTFIAPAHPPIRFSVSGNGFQELLAQVDPRNRTSLNIIEELAKLNQDAEAQLNAGPSATSLEPNGDTAHHEGRHAYTPPSVITPTMIFGSPSVDNSSVTTISAPSSQGHDDLTQDQPVTSNGPESDLLQRGILNNTLSPRSSRSSSSRSNDPPARDDQYARLDANSFSYHTDANLSGTKMQSTAPTPDSSIPRMAKLDSSLAIIRRLQDALQDAARRGTTQITLDQEFVQAVVMMIEQRRDENAKTKGKLDHIKDANQRANGGLVAYDEYAAELRVRREAEAEVTRLRVLLSGQAARITALSGQGRKDELHKQLSHDLKDSLSVLEQDVAKLKVERDVALVEMEEIASSRSSAPATERDGANLTRSLSIRLDSLKVQYKDELASLTDERESLFREIAELQSARDVFLEETTVLNARNEELAQLNAHYMRRIEATSPIPAQEKRLSDRQRPVSPLPSSHTLNSSFGTSWDESADFAKYAKVQHKPSTGVFKWRGNNKETNTVASTVPDGPNEKATWLRHAFQQVSVLRLSKCDHCGEKLWGSQARCQTCHISVHPRCQQNVHVLCLPQISRRDDGSATAPLQPAMFGRELTEQVRADSKVTDRMVPLIVEKCIAASLDYEGIYRKTGGSAQSKLITQLFERGDYAAFDLFDRDRFNDICSITSVLKTYFRTLPNPLLTFVLHDEFIFAASISDPVHKSAKYADLVKQLPTEHYYTLRALMYHLYRIKEHHEENLMTARNLGVVFGPTLMRSRNPGAEFSDMAGKALTIEWLVENAPTVFPPLSTSH
ncbi:RhoGAP-domain-containing protein [Russula earlei]|uniref:RhoGAP-domain-containing protein n=1 Tax=Russula earlei TaxID=71964 RepID=A0ACC0U349_9AGAM|nr:RhoGAP-domain-containing protein [Russula earlei]